MNQLTNIYILFRHFELELLGISLLKATLTSLILSLHYPNLSLIAFPLITAFIYIQDRLHPNNEDHINKPTGQPLIQKHHTTINTISITTLILYELALTYAAIQFIHTGTPTHAITTLILGNYPLLAYIPYNYFKPHLLIDTLAVSTSWATAAIFLPQIFTGTIYINQTVITLFLFYTIGETALVELYNVPDTDGDKQHGQTTLPTLIGPLNTILTCTILSLIALTTLTLITTNPLIHTLAIIWLTSEYIFIYPQLKTQYKQNHTT